MVSAGPIMGGGTVTKWLLYIIGILLIIMGILGFVGFPFPNLKDPAWHAALKIIVGLIAIWGGTKAE
ncbi:MAG: hypothetical protein PHR99_04950 [Methanobacteriales archaeon]|nr:hypothetical protein [Methanobacteriales archaeon]